MGKVLLFIRRGNIAPLWISDLKGLSMSFPSLENMALVLRNCLISDEIPSYIWSRTRLEEKLLDMETVDILRQQVLLKTLVKHMPKQPLQKKWSIMYRKVHCKVCYSCQSRCGLLLDSRVTVLSGRTRRAFRVRGEEKKKLKENGLMVIVVAEGAGQELVAESIRSMDQEDASGNKLLLDVGLWISQKIKNTYKQALQHCKIIPKQTTSRSSLSTSNRSSSPNSLNISAINENEVLSMDGWELD